MHIFFYIRGKAEEVERWKHFMLCQYFKWERMQIIKDKKGKEKQVKVVNLVQAKILESYQGMYEYIFPREALSEVLSMTRILNDSTGKKFGFWGLRRLYGLRAVKESEYEAARKIPADTLLTNRWRGLVSMPYESVHWAIIGIKEDKYGPITFYKGTKNEVTYNQEWL